MLLLALLVAFGSLNVATADPAYPPLTGRVVDNAEILGFEAQQAIVEKLADLERRSGIQLVVATLPWLHGEEIEPYANGLFRNWKLGDARANDGVLLLVAPNQRKVRIEVGYGEEGTLTDALSGAIITHAMVPAFKTGDYEGGIKRGVDDIITVLTTEAASWQNKPSFRSGGNAPRVYDVTIPFFGILALLMLLGLWSWKTRGKTGKQATSTTRTGWSGGSSGGGSSSSGSSFSGGGGSSGGGGASGSW